MHLSPKMQFFPYLPCPKTSSSKDYFSLLVFHFSLLVFHFSLQVLPNKISTKQEMRDWVSSLSFTYREYGYVDDVTNEGDLLDKIGFVELKEQFSEGSCPPLDLLPNLTRVRVLGRGSREIAEVLSNVPMLSELELLGWDFESVPCPELASLQLKSLQIAFEKEDEVPSMVFQMASLEELTLGSYFTLHVPDRFDGLSRLKYLVINAKVVDPVPYSINECKDLETLDLRFPVMVSRLLQGMQRLQNLGIKALYEEANAAADFETIRQLPPLRDLYLYGTASMRLWSVYQKWNQIRFLVLKNGDVRTMELEGSLLTSMIALTIDDCDMQQWPEWMRELQNLKQLTVEYNFGLGEPPDWVTALPRLIYLDLYGNGFQNGEKYIR